MLDPDLQTAGNRTIHSQPGATKRDVLDRAGTGADTAAGGNSEAFRLEERVTRPLAAVFRLAGFRIQDLRVRDPGVLLSRLLNSAHDGSSDSSRAEAPRACLLIGPNVLTNV